jgi:EAL domain
VVKSILDLTAALGIQSVAEGVESAEIAAALSAMGCVAGQGWYFAKPMPAVTATAWLTEHGAAEERASQAPAGWEPISHAFDDAIAGESGAVRLHDHVLLRDRAARRDFGASPRNGAPGCSRAAADGPAALADGTAVDGTAVDGTALDGTALDGTAVDGTAELQTRIVVPPTGWLR